MHLREAMKRSRHNSATLAPVVSMSASMVRKARNGSKRLSADSFPRFYWALKGMISPEAHGFDPQKIWLPPLDRLPDPDEPGVCWDRDCAPVLTRMRAAEAAAKANKEGAGANP